MLKGPRCYCNRLYPGSQCAYHRLADELADKTPPAPIVRRPGERTADTEKSKSWWTRVATFGKSILGEPK